MGQGISPQATMIEFEVTTPDGVPTGDIVKVLPYRWRALERQCAEQAIDPSDYLSWMANSLLDILKNSEEAREAFSKGEFGEWLNEHIGTQHQRCRDSKS